MRHAALFYRCVLLNAFKELFTAKYLCLCTFFKYCECVYVGATIAVRSLPTLLRSMNVCMQASMFRPCHRLLRFVFDSRHSHCRFQTITMFHSIFVHKSMPCNFYNSRYFIVFRLCNSQFILARVLFSPIPPCACALVYLCIWCCCKWCW